MLLGVGELSLAVAVAGAAGGIDRDHEFATARRAGLAGVRLVGLETEHVADQRTREQLDHQRDGRTLVAAERELSAGQRGRGIGGRLTVRADRPALGEGFPVAQVDLDLAARAGTRCLVEDERRPSRPRPGERHRVRPVERPGAAGRCNVSERRGEGECDETSLGKPLDLRPQRRHVVRIHDGKRRNAEFARPLLERSRHRAAR